MTTYYLANKESDCENGLDSQYNVGSYDLEIFTNECAAAAADANCAKYNVDTGTFKQNGTVWCANLNRNVRILQQQMKCKMSDCYELCPEYGP